MHLRPHLASALLDAAMTREIGENLTDEELHTMIDEFDRDGDRAISPKRHFPSVVGNTAVAIARPRSALPPTVRYRPVVSDARRPPVMKVTHYVRKPLFLLAGGKDHISCSALSAVAALAFREQALL
ncbi:unnamed protein product [Schistocephalus solidus]|uniref:EF-hand domain-containing protein n=1 Tax=Schistocephalus solidus TaxID=70667 RepID=A0A183TCD2_SCHSO|nr:unnamed protein product [Schistocephalus solidus]